MPLNAEDFLNGKKVQKEMTITEKTRQAIRAGIESVNNNTGTDFFSVVVNKAARCQVYGAENPGNCSKSINMGPHQTCPF